MLQKTPKMSQVGPRPPGADGQSSCGVFSAAAGTPVRTGPRALRFAPPAAASARLRSASAHKLGSGPVITSFPRASSFGRRAAGPRRGSRGQIWDRTRHRRGQRRGSRRALRTCRGWTRPGKRRVPLRRRGEWMEGGGEGEEVESFLAEIPSFLPSFLPPNIGRRPAREGPRLGRAAGLQRGAADRRGAASTAASRCRARRGGESGIPPPGGAFPSPGGAFPSPSCGFAFVFFFPDLFLFPAALAPLAGPAAARPCPSVASPGGGHRGEQPFGALEGKKRARRLGGSGCKALAGG